MSIYHKWLFCGPGIKVNGKSGEHWRSCHYYSSRLLCAKNAECFEELENVLSWGIASSLELEIMNKVVTGTNFLS
jgi:hypothetical protein